MKVKHTNEIWKWIPGYRGYYKVSNYGRVKSIERYVDHPTWGLRFVGRKILAPIVHSRGYHRVALYKGKTESRLVHRLVLEAFVGPRPEGMQCRHLNDIPTDNRLRNLRWGTPKQNTRDAVRNGKRPGPKHKANIKLDRED